jgi:hypothetical protein
VCVVNKREPISYALSFIQLFKEAEADVNLITIPQDSGQYGVVTYSVDAVGNFVAETLWRLARIGGGVIGSLPAGLESVPADKNCLIVGENDSAFQPGSGQPGEGLDEHGRPVPAPK